jgi:hypothetical protein
LLSLYKGDGSGHIKAMIQVRDPEAPGNVRLMLQAFAGFQPELAKGQLGFT